MELSPIAHPQLGEHLVKVVTDRSVTDEQPCPDLAVGMTLRRKPRDLYLLRSELVSRRMRRFTNSLSGRGQLAGRASHKRLRPE